MIFFGGMYNIKFNNPADTPDQERAELTQIVRDFKSNGVQMVQHLSSPQ